MTCDGRSILDNFGETSCGPGRIVFDNQGALVDAAMAFLPHKVVHMKLPAGVFIQANRWPNFMNAKIEMPKMEGQDGVCGNYNGDASDDGGKELHQRFGHGVQAGEEIFATRLPLHVPSKMPNSKRCSLAKRKQAEDICHAAATEVGWSFAECLGDVCDKHTAAASVQAEEMKKMASQALR